MSNCEPFSRDQRDLRQAAHRVRAAGPVLRPLGAGVRPRPAPERVRDCWENCFSHLCREKLETYTKSKAICKRLSRKLQKCSVREQFVLALGNFWQ